MTRAPRVRVLTALRCEARPLVECFGLERRGAGGRSGSPPALVDLYENETMVVACCGVGKIAMARAVGWLHARLDEEPQAPWLNLGTAGGRELRQGVAAELGQLALAAKVVDAGTEWANRELASAQARAGADSSLAKLPRARHVALPPQLVRGELPAAIVHTVDAVEVEYAEPGLFEMEASSFVAAARSLSTAEMVQVAKVVSDTPHHCVTRLDARTIESLVAARLNEIAGLISRLHRLLPQDLPDLERWQRELTATGRWSFTQRQQLHKLLLRWHALRGEIPAPPPGASDARALLDWLQHELEETVPRLSPEQPMEHKSAPSSAPPHGQESSLPVPNEVPRER